jgi:hypothetical protein
MCGPNEGLAEVLKNMRKITRCISVITTATSLLLSTSLLAVPVFPTDPANSLTNAVTIPPGWSLIANPYYHNRGATVADAVPDNTVGKVLKSVPQGTRLLKYDNATGRFSENRFHGKKWSHPDQTLTPGEGAFIYNPGRRAFTLAFTGNCLYGGSVLVPAGFSLISSPDCGIINFKPLVWPPPEGCFGPGPIGSTNLVPVPCPPIPPFGWDSLSFNPQEGDVVYTFDNATREFETHTFHNGAWDRVPVVRTAQACLVSTAYSRVICWIGLRPF